MDAQKIRMEKGMNFMKEVKKSNTLANFAEESLQV